MGNKSGICSILLPWKVFGAPGMILQPFLATLSCFQLPLSSSQNYFCPLFNNVFPPLLLSTTFFFFFLSLLPAGSFLQNRKIQRRGQTNLVSVSLLGSRVHHDTLHWYRLVTKACVLFLICCQGPRFTGI